MTENAKKAIAAILAAGLFSAFTACAAAEEKPGGAAPILAAAAAGKFAEVKRLAESGADVNAKTATGDTALHYMAMHGFGDAVEFLAARGADPSARNAEGHTPLFLAAVRNRRDAVAALEKITKTRAEDILKKEAFVQAARGRYLDLAAILKLHPEYAKLRDGEGMTLLHHAAAAGRLAVTRFLVSRGVPLDGEDAQGLTPLFHAILNGRTAAFDYLLENGASATHRAKSKATPLHTAAACEGAAAASCYMSYALIMNGADVNSKMENAITPAWLAAGAGNTETVKLLARKGAYLSDRTADGSSPAAIAKERGHEGLSKMIADLDIRTMSAPSENDIFTAAAVGDLERVKKIAEAFPGAVRKAGDGGNTPLHVAALSGRTDVVKYLLEKKADISAENSNGRNALEAIADSPAAKGQKEAAALLASKGLSVGAGGKKQKARLFVGSFLDDLLFSAIFNFQNGMAAAALKAGAKADSSDMDGAGPLHVAVMAVNQPAAEILLSAGAKIGSADRHGRTPLHLASEFGDSDMVSFLVSKGADPGVADADGKTPLDVALANGFSDLAEIISKSKK